MMLAVLVPCLANRPWHKVVRELASQCKGTQARVFHTVDKGEMTSGQKRHAMCQIPEVKAATYRCFVDDDDLISGDYVQALLEGCESGVDVVSFNLLFTHARKGRRDEVWRFGFHPNRRSKGLMCVNHLCAWKTEIASRVAWCPRLGYGDDHLWFQPIYHAGLAKTHHHIDRTLYTYVFNPSVTANQSSTRMNAARSYVGPGLGCYKMPYGEILVQDGHDTPEGMIRLRDRDNTAIELALTPELRSCRYHNVTLA